jgi:hypothetical protein
MKCLTTIAALLLGTGILAAAPVTYTFSGLGTGLLGSNSFTNASFVTTITTDTSQVAFQSQLSSWGAIGIPASISIAGLGSATFTGTTVLYDFTHEVGFAVGDSGFLTAPGNIMAVDDNSLVGYQLLTNLTVSGPNPYVSSISGVGTTGGGLTFSHMSPVTFQTVVGTPEPGSIFLLLGAIGALLLKQKQLIRKRRCQ